MSISAVLSQLKGLVEKAEQLPAKLSKTYPSDDQWETLAKQSVLFSNAASQIQRDIQRLKKSRTMKAQEESKKHISHANSSKGELFATGRLKLQAVFRKNIVMIFEEPRLSVFDSEDTRFRKESTRKRCNVIRSLSSDGIIAWAIAYAQTLWAGGAMASDVFDCLINDIEPEVIQIWPSMIGEILHKLKEDEAYLQTSFEYEEFLKGLFILVHE